MALFCLRTQERVCKMGDSNPDSLGHLASPAVALAFEKDEGIPGSPNLPGGGGGRTYYVCPSAW